VRTSPRFQTECEDDVPFHAKVLRDFIEPDDEDESEDTGRINVNGPWVPRPEGTRIGTTWSILYHLSEDEEWSRAAATIGGEPVVKEIPDGKGGCTFEPTGQHYITIYFADMDQGWYDVPSEEYRSRMRDGYIFRCEKTARPRDPLSSRGIFDQVTSSHTSTTSRSQEGSITCQGFYRTPRICPTPTAWSVPQPV
jgi:hypothetical protein